MHTPQLIVDSAIKETERYFTSITFNNKCVLALQRSAMFIETCPEVLALQRSAMRDLSHTAPAKCLARIWR